MSNMIPVITHQVQLRPFIVPNVVIQIIPPGKPGDGFRETPDYKLGELSDETLDLLCNQFREEVFRKAADDRRSSVVSVRANGDIL